MVFNKEIFSPSFPFDGPHLVAASAGTGKTHNIQNICARLVMERGLRASEMLVVTFTEAATKELRDRLRKVLADLLRLFSGDTGGMEPRELERLEKLRGCARSVLGGAAAEADLTAKTRVELALLSFDQAAVSTIHSFCRRVIARFAFETGGAFQAELGDDGGAELARRARDWWRVHRPPFPLADLVAAAAGLGGKQDWTIEKDPATGEKDPCLVAAAGIVRKYETDRAVRDTLTFDDLLRTMRDALDPKTNPIRAKALAEHLRREFKAVVIDEFQDTDPTQYAIFRKAFIEGVPEGERPPIFFVGDPKQAIYSFRGGDIYTYRAAAKSPEVAGRTYRLDRNYRSTPKLVDAANRLFGDAKGCDGMIVSRTFGDAAIPYEEDVLAMTDGEDRIEGLAVTLPDGRSVEDPHPFRIVRTERGADRDAAVVDLVLETLAEQKGRKIRIKDAVEEFGPKHIAILVTANDAGDNYRRALRDRGVPAVVSRSGNVFAGETAAEFRLVLEAMADGRDRRLVRTALATPFFDFPVEELQKEDGTAFADKAAFFGELNRTWTKRGFNAAFAKLEDGCRLRSRFASLPAGERKLADLFQIVDLAGAAARERGPSPNALVDWISERICLSGDEGPEADSEEYARELESDADAVRIITVHKAKGLEYPVTIVPVASAKGRGNAGKDGTRPPRFYHGAGGSLFVGRGEGAADESKKENDAEKTRLLYVALTRATRRAIVVAPDPPIPAFGSLLDNARLRGAGEGNPPDSPILWSDYAPPSEPLPDYRAVPDGRPFAEAESPRDYEPFREKAKGSYSSLSPSPKGEGDGSGDGDSAFRDANGESVATDGVDRDRLSALDDPLSTAETAPDGTPAEGADHPIFAIGGGARTGTCWHDILEKIPFDATLDRIKEATDRSMRLHGLARGDGTEVAERVEAVAEMIRDTLDWRPETGDRFPLRDVPMDRRFSEWEFDFSSANAVDRTPAIKAILEDEWRDDPGKADFLRAAKNWDRKIPKGFFVGFLDLLFEHGGRWYVVDWKSNKIGGSAKSFSAAGVRGEMAREGYFFQYLLYSAVVHRFLKETMGGAYSWERHFGGVRYYFLRGIAAGGEAPVFEDRPGESLLNRLCGALGMEGPQK